MPSYWSGVVDSRFSRRRALAGSAGVALGAAALAACGGGKSSSKSSSSGTASGLITKPEDTTKRAVRGGTLLDAQVHDVAGFDPHQGTVIAGYGLYWTCCSQFVKVKPGIYPNASQGD